MIKDYIGLKLIDINYSEVANAHPYLSIFKDDVEIEFGFIGEVLSKIQNLKDKVIKESNTYFQALVLRI